MAGLAGLKYVCKKYEFEWDEGRAPLNEIVDNIFPILEELYSNIESESSYQAIKIKSIISTIFYISNQLFISNRYQSVDGLNILLQFFLRNIEAPIEPSLTTFIDDPDEIEKRSKDHNWKIWSTSMHFIFWMF